MKTVSILALLVTAGWAADAEIGPTPLRLTLKRAVEIATSKEGNTNLQLAAEALKQSQSRSNEARASLLPDVESSFTDQSRTENLAALGIGVRTIPIPGF